MTQAVEKRMDAMVLTIGREWTARDASRTHDLLRAYGMFFDVYRGKAPWFYVAELSFAVVANALVGLKASTGCEALGWMMAALFVAQAAVLIVLRPHAVRLDRVLYAMLAVAQAAAAVFGAVANALASAHGEDAASTVRARTAGLFFLSAVGMSAGLVACYEIGKVVYQQWQVRRRERRDAAAAGAGAAETASDALNARLLLEAPELDRGIPPPAAFAPAPPQEPDAPPPASTPPAAAASPAEDSHALLDALLATPPPGTPTASPPPATSDPIALSPRVCTARNERARELEDMLRGAGYVADSGTADGAVATVAPAPYMPPLPNAVHDEELF